MSVVSGQPKKKHANPSYKATKHIERTFPIFDYYTSSVLVVVSVVKRCGILYQVEISKVEFC